MTPHLYLRGLVAGVSLSNCSTTLLCNARSHHFKCPPVRKSRIELVRYPEKQHEIVDMDAVRSLRDELDNRGRKLQELHSYQVGWERMADEVSPVKNDAQACLEKMNKMECERRQEASMIEQERNLYKAAIHGFSDLERERDRLREDLTSLSVERARESEAHKQDVHRLEKERERLRNEHASSAKELASLQETYAHTIRSLHDEAESARKELVITQQTLQQAREDLEKAQQHSKNATDTPGAETSVLSLDLDDQSRRTISRDDTSSVNVKKTKLAAKFDTLRGDSAAFVSGMGHKFWEKKDHPT